MLKKRKNACPIFVPFVLIYFSHNKGNNKKQKTKKEKGMDPEIRVKDFKGIVDWMDA